MENEEKESILRCPIIQGLNDQKQHFQQIKVLRQKYPNIKTVEIMPYHATGKHKWGAIGKPYTLENLETAPQELKQYWEEQIK